MFFATCGGIRRLIQKTTVSLHYADIINSKLAQDNHVFKSFVFFYATRPQQDWKSDKSHQNKRKRATSPKSEQPERTFLKDDRAVFSSYHAARIKAREKFSTFLQKNSAEAWVNRSPPSIKPYLQLIRADKPTGTLLLYFPCVFSICMAAPPGTLPSFYCLALFGVGSFLMRGAGCIINDLWDRDIDKQVERTRDRPIASGQVTPRNAMKLLAANLTLSLGILLSLNSTCVVIGFASMVPVILYPLAKRYTNYPQIVLGMTFNIGAVMGYTAVTGQMDLALQTALYGSCIIWTIYYDTIYAFQDVSDDERIGVKSMARLFSRTENMEEFSIAERMTFEHDRRTKITSFLWVMGSTHLVLFALAGFYINLDGPLYLALAVTMFRMIQEVIYLEVASRESCWKVFKNTKWHGLILTLGIISAIYVKKKEKSKKLSIDQQ